MEELKLREDQYWLILNWLGQSWTSVALTTPQDIAAFARRMTICS